MVAVAQTRQIVRDLSTSISSVLGLRELRNHVDVILISAVAFWVVQMLIAPLIGRALLGKGKWERWERRERNNWNIHIASFAHAVIILPLALGCLDLEPLARDKAFGWDDRLGNVAAISCGYFLWDTIECFVHSYDLGFVFHGLACFVIFLLAFKPFIAYYGPRFLLWELSTPFLDIHWFLDKLDMTGSTTQFVNGIFLLGTFAGARLVYGSYMSYEFWQTLYEIRNDVPLVICLVYGVGNIVLNGLNWFWFTKMIAALRKRMVPSGKNRHANGRHVADGDVKKA